MPPMPQQEPWRAASALFFAVEPHGVKFHAMVYQAIAQLLRNLLLQGFELGIDEFDHLDAFHVDQVIMVRFGRGFVA